MKQTKSQGIHEKQILTLDIINIALTIKDITFVIHFYVVNDEFPVKSSGIIGIPFFHDNDISLNLKKNIKRLGNKFHIFAF